MFLAATLQLDPAVAFTDRSWLRFRTRATALTSTRIPSAVGSSFSSSLISGLCVTTSSVATRLRGDGTATTVLFGVEAVSSGVESGHLGVSLGVPDALAGSVSFITGVGSQMHGLMEHGPSECRGLSSLSEGQFAYANVSHHVLGRSVSASASAGHDIGKGVASAMTAGSCISPTAHDVVVLEGVLQELHGVLVSPFDVLVVMGVPSSKPLSEAFASGVPAGVSISDLGVNSHDGVRERLLLGITALRVRRDGIVEPVVDVLDVPETFSSFLSCGLSLAY